MYYEICFVDTARTVRNFLRRMKLISNYQKLFCFFIWLSQSIFKMKKLLYQSTIFHGIILKGNGFISDYLPRTEQLF